MNKLFFTSIVVILIFAYIDSQQIMATYVTQDWELYNLHIAPAFLMSWTLTLLAISLVYWFLTGDKSESVALFVAPKIMLIMGLEDLFFFIFHPNTITACMDWLTRFPFTIFNQILGITCTNITTLFISATAGIFMAYYSMDYLRRKW